MKSKKQSLGGDMKLKIKLIGINSQEIDYKICFKINQELNIDLERTDDIEVFNQKLNVMGSYSTFFYEDEDEMLEFMLIANYHPAGLLLYDAGKYDYFLRISGEIDFIDGKEIAKKLRNINSVIFSAEMNVDHLKSKENLFL
ncbi:MAG: IPExxxVDY family protein [Flavobacteriales bacterium]